MKNETKIEEALRKTNFCIEQIDAVKWDCDYSVYDMLEDIRNTLKSAVMEAKEEQYEARRNYLDELLGHLTITKYDLTKEADVDAFDAEVWCSIQELADWNELFVGITDEEAKELCDQTVQFWK